MQIRPILFLFAHLTVVVMGASGALAASEAREPSKAEKLKAAYLLNFTKFMEWPDSNEEQSLSPIRICLQDGTPFEGFFNSLIADRESNGNKRKVVVRQLTAAAQCELTFLHHARRKIDPTITYGLIVLNSTKIPETDAAIVFYVLDRKLRFEIVLDRVVREGVLVSSELLKLARIK